MTRPRTRSSQAGRLAGGLIAISSLALIALIVVALLEGGAVGGAEPRPARGETGQPAPETLVTGTVTDADGPVADLQVRVTIWPEEDDTEVGNAVDLFSVEPVRTDAHGRYAVVLSPDDVPAKYLMARRIVNFDVWLVDAGVAPVSTSARRPSSGDWWVGVSNERHDDPKSLDFDLNSMTATERSDGERDTWPLVEWR